MAEFNIPEAQHFLDAVAVADPDQLTACSAWRVHELVAHLAAGAAEVARNLEAYARGGVEEVPTTRSLDEREVPFRAMTFADLQIALSDGVIKQANLLSTILGRDPDAVTPWTGRQMPVAAFVNHTRNEFAIHRWDIVGNDELSDELLADPALTKHAVTALGRVLGSWPNGVHGGPTVAIEAPGQPTIFVGSEGLTFENRSTQAPIRVICETSSDRLLFLWTRTPRPGRIRVLGESGALDHVRSVLPGY